MNDKDVTIVIRANTQQFAAAMAAAQQMAKKMGTGIASGATPAVSAFKTIQSGVDSATKSIEYMIKRGAMIGTAVAGLAGFGIKAQAELETAEVGFTTLLGSSQKAREAIEMIKKDAKSTPFELPGLLSANQLLTSVTEDAKRSETFLLNVGKALSAMGKGQPELDRIIINLQQIAQVGHASEIDMKQFAYAGVDAYKLIAESTGMSVKEVRALQDEGKLTFDMLEKAFNDAGTGAGKYAKAFENAGGTWNQIWSNFKDTMSQSMASIVKDSGLFDEVKKQAQNLMTWVDQNKDEIGKWVKGAFEWIMKNGNTIKNVIIGIAGAYAVLKTISVTMKIIEGVQNAIKIGMMAWKAATVAFTAAQWLLNAALNANPIGLVIIAITALIAAIVLLWNNSETFRNIVTGAFNAVWGAIQAVWDWVKNNWPLLLAILLGPIGIAVALIIKNWDVIKDAFAKAWEFIKGVWSGVGRWFGDIWNGIKNAFGSVTNWFRDTFSNAWQAVKNVFSAGGQIFSGIKDSIAGVFKAVVNGIIGGINTVVAVPFNAINGALKRLKDISIVGKHPFSWIPTISVPQIPKLAEGGIVKQPGLFMAGEAGAEVLPIQNNTGWADNVADVIAKKMKRSDDTPPTTNNYTFNIEIKVENDGTDFTEAQATGMAKQIVRALRGQGLQINEMGALR